MKREDLETARKNALRFIATADEALEKSFVYHRPNGNHKGFWSTDSHQYTAAAKRASMDLTRALAKVRKP